MRKNGTLDHDASFKYFFDHIQFPIGYTFPQNQTTGVVDRSFTDLSAFGSGQNLNGKPFSLVNPETGNALSLSFDDRLVQEEYSNTNSRQQFILNNDDQLESVYNRSGELITATECNYGGDTLILSTSPPDFLHAPGQKWRFYKDGIVNLACSQMNRNLAITEIEDDAFDHIPNLDGIHFSLVNPSTGKAISAGAATQVCFYCTAQSFRYRHYVILFASFVLLLFPHKSVLQVD